MSLVASVNNCAEPIASLIELLMITRISGFSQIEVTLAAYAAVSSILSFCVSVFTFVVVINIAGVGNHIGILIVIYLY